MIAARIKQLYRYRHTLREMAVSQLKTKYASSILGISLALINPFLIAAAITFVFTAIFKVEIKRFPIFVLSGIIPWTFFSNSLSETAVCILNQQNILRQFNLPREIIPLSSVLANFLNFLIGWVIIYPVFLFFKPKIVFLFPHFLVVIFANLLLVIGLGMIISVLNVFFRDIGNLLSVILMFLFWITPIFYNENMIPGGYRWILNCSPLKPFIIYYQRVLYEGLPPDLLTFLVVIFWASLALISGFYFFLHVESKLLKRI
jgi:ABC-type polysaccharide/polyol phosphate export permease